MCEGRGKKYLKDLYDVNTEKQSIVSMCYSEDRARGSYLEGKPAGRASTKGRVKS